MIEGYIEKDEYNRIFNAGFIDALSCSGIEKDAFGLGDVVGGIKGLGKALWDVGSGGANLAGKMLSSIPWLVATGAGVGAMGAMGYDALKDSLTEQSPAEELNAEIESRYALRTKELEDAKWMARARAKRDKLKREGKRMSVDQYAKEYQELVDILNERSA